MAERVRLNKPSAPPRPKLSAETKWNGWEKQDAASDNMIYRLFLVCYTGSGFVREKHGFKTEEAAREFASIHPAPGSR